MKLKKESKAFKTHLERLGYSKTSILMLPNCFKEFLEFTNKELGSIVSQDILNYRAYLQNRPNKKTSGGLSESYINHHIYALKVFFAWQEELGLLTANPISSLSFPTPKSQPREIATPEEIKQLYKATDCLRERAVLSIFYGCGLRRTEGEKLDLKDVHFRSGILYVRKGKGSKRRAIPMSKGVVKDLKDYVYKERKTKGEEKAFFINRIGKRSSGSSLNKDLKNILEVTPIKKVITLHCLRHSIATHLLENGLTLDYVREFLGHAHLETTQRYTRVKNSQLWSMKY